MSGQLHAPAALAMGKNTGTHWIEGWVGPREGLDILKTEKCLLLPGFKLGDFPGRSLVAIMTTLCQLLPIKTAVVQSGTPIALIPLPAPAQVQRQFQKPHFFQLSVLHVVLHLDV